MKQHEMRTDKASKGAAPSTSQLKHPVGRAPVTVISHAKLPPEALRRLGKHVPNRTLQRLVGEQGGPLSDSAEQMIQRELGSGQALEPGLQARMGQALAVDLRNVRVHNDVTADQLAGDLGARAFTVGEDIFFASGEYQPAISSGQQVIAHELAHVMQNSAAPQPKLRVGAVDDPDEAQADAVAARVLDSLHQEPSVKGSGNDPSQTLQRQEEEEEELQLLRRTEADDEEELIEPLRRQEEEEEEEVQPLRRAEADDEEELVLPLRRTASDIRRVVSGDVRSQTLTATAVQQMNDAELREQTAILQQQIRELGSADSPERQVAQSNLSLIEAEVRTRAAQSPADVERLCRNRLTIYGNLLQNIKDDSFSAMQRGVADFTNFSAISDPPGIQIADVFSVVLSMVPFAGPISKLIENNLVNQAILAMAQAGAAAAVSRGESEAAAASGAREAEGRAHAASGAAGAAGDLQRRMGVNLLTAISTYQNAIELNRSDASRLRIILISLNEQSAAMGGLSAEHYNQLAAATEVRLYREYYQRRAYLLVYENEEWGTMSQQIQEMPSAVQRRLVELGESAGGPDLARRWGLRVETIRTSSGFGSLR